MLVPVTGLEPVRHRWRWILSPLRLPFHHTGRCVTIGYILRSAARGAGVRLRCPKFPARFRSRNFDRCPSLGSLHPPPAALPSLPRLSPVRCRQRWILSPLRLPFHHTGRCDAVISLIADTVYNTFSKIARGKSAQSQNFPPFGGLLLRFLPEAVLPLCAHPPGRPGNGRVLTLRISVAAPPALSHKRPYSDSDISST